MQEMAREKMRKTLILGNPAQHTLRHYPASDLAVSLPLGQPPSYFRIV